MNVPLADLRKQYLSLKSEIDAAIRQVIDNSQFILGKAVAEFERSFADAHRANHCIAVGSGTDALHIALWSLGIGSGDVVVTVPFTFIATVEAISLVGARPVFVDIDERTYTMDPDRLEAAMKRTHHVKAILPVHLYGLPAAMKEIADVSRRHDVPIVEDACQAHLATYGGRFVGQFGAAACFSFYPGKNLGAYGEAGAVLTNDDELALRIRRLRDHGQVEKYRHDYWGHNYRMDGIQGAVLGVKLRSLRSWTDRRREISRRYTELLRNVGDLILPFEPPGVEHVYHIYAVRSKRRDALQQYLAGKGIATGIAYPVPLHLQRAYKHLGHSPGDFPASEAVAADCLSLPIYAEMDDEQVEHVASSIQAFYRD